MKIRQKRAFIHKLLDDNELSHDDLDEVADEFFNNYCDNCAKHFTLCKCQQGFEPK
jgi:hypothetical protein